MLALGIMFGRETTSNWNRLSMSPKNVASFQVRGHAHQGKGSSNSASFGPVLF